MRIGTIGTSFIVDWFLNAAQQNEGIQVEAMYTRRKESATALAAKYNITMIYTDYEDMLQDDTIDTIYIASPNSLHFIYAKQALEAGKHVICEKPFTSTVKEFLELKNLAKQQNCFLFEAIVTAHMPNYLKIKEQLPNLGKLRMIQCNFSQYSSRYDKFLAGETPNVFNPAYSGGALADINIYNLHFVIGLAGKPEAVHYYPNKHANGIDTSGVVILQYPDFQAVCIGCKDTRSQCMTQIQGEQGFITMESETSRCANAVMTVGKDVTELTTSQNDDALFYELKDFERIIQAQDYDTCWKMLEYAQVVMEVFEAARKDGNIIFAADKASF